MTVTAGTITIPTWANGPDGSGNGGYSAGLLAALLTGSGAVSVSLRRPPPLGRPLAVHQRSSGTLELLDGDVLVAQAAPASIDWQAPEAVRLLDPETAAAASTRFPFRSSHPFPRCLACGTHRDSALPALALHCGPVDGLIVNDDSNEPAIVFADLWLPSPALMDADPIAASWAALDCPSAAPFADPLAASPSVLASFTVALDRPATVDAPHVVAAWRRSVDGRKQWSSSVLVDVNRREVIGRADALWIEVRPT